MTVLGKWITTAKEVVSMGNPNLSGVMKAYNIGGTMVGIDTGSVNRGQIAVGPQFQVQQRLHLV